MTKSTVDIAEEIKKGLQKNKNASKFSIDVSVLGGNDSPCVVSEWISTGCVVLDTIMGGGLPVGRMVEIFGDPSSGKSLIGAQIAAVAQDAGYMVAYIDTETAVSIPMMKKIGVDVDNLLYTSPDTVEEVFAFMEVAIETKHRLDPDNILVIVWDSVAATSSIAEMEKDYGQTGYLDHARIISQALRKITKQFSRERVAALFLNQVRDKMGVVFGDPRTTFGGKAIQFHASIRVALTLSGKYKVPGKKKAKVIGMDTNAVVVKNKLAMPFKEAKLAIYFGRAIDDAQTSLVWLENNDYITGSTWKRLELEKEELKFQKAQWPDLFDEHYDEISEIILSSIDEDDEDKYGEVEE